MNNKIWSSSILLASAIFLVGTFSSCASPGNQGQQDTTQDKQETSEKSGQETAQKKQQDRPDSWQERLSQTEREQQTELTANEKQARALLRAARRHYELGEYEKSREALIKSLEKDPGLSEAQELLNDVQLHLGRLESGREAGQSALEKWEATKEQLIKKTQLAFREGQEAMKNDQYAKAVDKFREVVSRIKFMPTVGPNLKDLRNRSQQFLKTAMEEKRKQEKLRKRKNQRAMQKLAEFEDYQRRLDRKQRIKRILERARIMFENQNYAGAEALLKQAEKLDPTIKEVKELKRIAWRLKHRNLRHELRTKSRREYLRWHRDVREKLISQSHIVRFPSEEEWRKVRNREPRGLRTEQRGPSEAEQEILSKLRNTQISVNFQNTPLTDVIKFFRDRVGINILIDRNAIPRPEQRTVGIQVQALSAYNVLNLILEMKNLDTRFDEGVLMVTTEQQAQEALFEIYDINDLDLRIKDFPAQAISLTDIENQAPGQGLGGGGISGGGSQQGTFSGKDIRDLIQQVIAPQSWSQPQNNIQFSDGLLLVRNSAEVHEEIKNLLENVRKSTGILVSVQARFLELRRSFLERVAVEFQDLAQPDLTEFTSGAVGSGSDFTALSPGIFETDSDRTFAGRISHAFGGLTNTPFQAINLAGFQGDGGNLQVGVFNDVTANAIMDLVHKDSRAREVTAPRVTLFNNQRGHVSFLRQIAYIRDQDPQVATAAIVPDPEIDIINDRAFVLDVKPIVSANRKYITMELRPTVAELLRPIQQSQISTVVGISAVLGSVTGIIEFPQLEVKQTKNTVAIPDGGTIMIGGMASALRSNRDSKVPVLGDIPIVGLLGHDRQEVNDLVELIVMVRGKVIIMEELEELRFQSKVDVSQGTGSILK